MCLEIAHIRTVLQPGALHLERVRLPGFFCLLFGVFVVHDIDSVCAFGNSSIWYLLFICFFYYSSG